ncbi:MAG: F0F1 ATP synthase subunit A [Ponticaulis sp.]|nr:F0F1 ATP synthase subunit A [Ponticaulis sp.]
MAIDPMHQFQLDKLIDLKIGGLDVSFSTSSLAMMLVVAILLGILLIAVSKPKVVPGKLQSVAELGYEFIANTVRDTIGEEGMKFFPFVFTLFLLIFGINMLGMIPYFETPTAQIVVTAALAILVFLTVIVYGFIKNGVSFLKLFVPSGAPWPLYFLLIPLEIISFFVRPVTLSLRLFGNILAGHIVLKLFVMFTTTLLGLASMLSVIAIFPFTAAIAFTALEFLVAFLQAYIFAVLTCVYLNDAFHPSH